jgi:predicted DNA-binding protein (MmcQ/YjbR family)
MSLHTRAGFADFATSLPGVTVHEQWESLVAKVGGKVFALMGDSAWQVVFKVPEDSFDILTTQEGVAQAAYFAKRQWVSVERGALDDAALKAYIARSHRIIAGKLTRKARAELGLETYLAEEATGSTA